MERFYSRPQRQAVAEMRARIAREIETHRMLRIREAQTARVLELWHTGGLSTLCIAQQLSLDEADVCALIEEAETGFCKQGSGF